MVMLMAKTPFLINTGKSLFLYVQQGHPLRRVAVNGPDDPVGQVRLLQPGDVLPAQPDIQRAGGIVKMRGPGGADDG